MKGESNPIVRAVVVTILGLGLGILFMIPWGHYEQKKSTQSFSGLFFLGIIGLLIWLWVSAIKEYNGRKA